MNNLSPQTSHASFDPSDASLPTLASQQGWLINRLSRRRADMLIDALAPLNLSAREAAVLSAVRELPSPIAQLEIGAALALDQGSIAASSSISRAKAC